MIVRTWVIIDLLLVSALVGAWIGWRISKRKVEQARAAADAAASSAPDVAALPPRRAPASVPAFNAAGRDRTPAPVEKSKLQVVVDVAQGRGEDVLASLRPALGIAESSADAADDVDEGAAADNTGGDAADESESDAETDAPAKNGDVDLRCTTDGSGPLGADRLIFHTDNAPALLTKVLTGLRGRGYEIEMVVDHEVILHDVDAGVARICVAHSGDDVAAAGGLAPT